MKDRYDVLVIGGGVAGVCAALEAAAAGAAVALVRAGPGASALASGAWLGELPPRLARALAAAGLPFVPCPSPLPHPFGELRAADFAAESHAAARIDGDSCVCGIAGLPGFRGAALARMWQAPRHFPVLLPDTPAGGWSPVSLAARIEQNPLTLAAALRAAPAGCRLVVPAVLGLDPTIPTRAIILQALGREVGEALGTPPSVPGWRLDRALLAALAAAAVPLVEGMVVDRRAKGARLASVLVAGAKSLDGTHAGDGLRSISADSFVLATGRFMGGGITSRDVLEEVDVARGQKLREATLHERALRCDVWIEHLGDRFTQVQPVPLTDPVREQPQALLRAGVHVDADGRPLDEHGHVHFENVRARGTVIAGQRHGLGHAATATPGSAATAARRGGGGA